MTCSSCLHGVHTRSRNFGQGGGLSAEMGEAEAYAFLGAWLLGAAGMGGSKAAHAQYVPSEYEVLQYGLMQQWKSATGIWVAGTT